MNVKVMVMLGQSVPLISRDKIKSWLSHGQRKMTQIMKWKMKLLTMCLL